MYRNPLAGTRSAPVYAQARLNLAPKPTHGRRLWALLLIGVALALVSSSVFAPVSSSTPSSAVWASYTQTSGIYVRAVRTSWSTTAVLGVQNGTGAGVGVTILVDGAVRNSTTTIYNGEFWVFYVPVANGSSVQAAIGTYISNPASVPAYGPQPVAPTGLIYARGSQLMLNGTPIQLFGVDEETAFTYALIASGLASWSNPSQFWGNNQLFPSGPNTKIGNVSNVDQLWQKFFQYFLHYNQVTGTPSNPKTNLIRITVVDDSFVSEGVYNAWKSNPTAFWHIFDTMLYWADRAGLYVVPVLGHLANGPSITPDEAYYNVSSLKFAHHVDLVRAILARYNNNSRIAMWDLWNEPDVWNNNYWSSIGGLTGFRTWAATYIADVKPYGSNHLINMGIGGFTLFPGIPSFGWEYYFFLNDVPGLDVGSNHYYATAQDQYLIDWPTAWHTGFNRPNFEGEFGYNAAGNSLGYGYWPWYAQQSRASGWPAIATMVYLNDGPGPYADYPYLGTLPDYPPANGTPPGPGPVASFAFSPTAPTAGQSVTFNGSTSSDTAPITSYSWTFGDGGSATGKVVTHAYSATGNYSASLTVSDSSASNATSRVVRVQRSGGPPPPPPSPPNVTTTAATGKGQTTATLNGNLGSVGSAASVAVGFLYGTNPTLAGAANTSAGTLTAPGPFSAAIHGLTTGTTYYYRAWATGSGFVSGSVMNFTAANSGTTPPHANTKKGKGNGATVATFSGNVTSLGSASSVNVGFLYGTSPTLAGAVNLTVGVAYAPGDFNLTVNGLVAGATYYYEAWAEGQGIGWGGILNLTLSATVAPPPGSAGILGVTYSPETQTVDVLFSEPMNRTSVVAALSLSPGASYQLSWASDSDLHLHLPTALSFSQEYLLTIGLSATGLNGQSMQGPFTFRFTIPAVSPATNTGSVWTNWLPWISLGLLAGWVASVGLLVRSRRRLRALRASARILARHVQELRSLNEKVAARVRVNPRSRPTGRAVR